jgi:hypothetical protein
MQRWYSTCWKEYNIAVDVYISAGRVNCSGDVAVILPPLPEGETNVIQNRTIKCP